jgi:hypothetical protein
MTISVSRESTPSFACFSEGCIWIVCDSPIGLAVFIEELRLPQPSESKRQERQLVVQTTVS